MEKPAKLRGHLLYLADMGGDPDQVLAGTGITFQAIDALTPLPTGQIAALFDIVASRLPDDFAIRCGRATRCQYMGVLGYRLANCATVRELLDTWCRYSIVIGYPLASRLLVRGDRWDLEFRPRYALTPRALRFCMETTLAGSLPSIHAITGHDITPSGYAFPFPAPHYLACYDPLWPTPISFGGGAGVISGRRIDIDLRLVAVDGDAKALCDDYCRQALARIKGVESLSDRLHTLFAGSPGRMPTAREAAALLGLSLRTLQRQLTDDGQSYHRRVEAFRQEQARHLLETGMEAKTIAYLLGFQDVGSFRRAFRQQTGLSPNQWRRAQAGAMSRSVDHGDFCTTEGAKRGWEPASVQA